MPHNRGASTIIKGSGEAPILSLQSPHNPLFVGPGVGPFVAVRPVVAAVAGSPDPASGGKSLLHFS